VSVAEVDLPKVKLGNTAQVTLDALSGKTYEAKVIAISPVGTVTAGVVNYSVTLEVTKPDSSIRPGMTANLNIVVEQRENTLLVPVRAVQTQGTRKIVKVQKDQTVIPQVVTVGLSNDTFAEITDGLQEGDVVLIGTTTTTSTGGGPGMGIPGLGGPGGPPP
jgi:HlyD family secretion protein